MIDIHSHFFPHLSRAKARSFGEQWPWLRDDGDGSGTIMRGDVEFRPVRDVLWDPRRRLAELDERGIACQIICATPILFAYTADPATAHAAAVANNDLAGTFCAVDPSRLKSLCQVPLQDLGRACDELDRAMASGHVGVQIGNHVGERDLDDSELVEFLQHCAATDVPVLIHPWDMFAPERMNRYMLQWLVAMPAETQLSILYLILSGAFERLPASLRLCFAHGGGSFAYLLGRVDNAWRERDIVRQDCPALPSTYCNRFTTDSVVFDDDALTLLAGRMGTQRILFGTDYPFPLGESVPGALVNGHPGLDQRAKQQILHDNAQAFFRLN